MSKNTAPLPDWELVLSSAARLQYVMPDAVQLANAVPYDLEDTELSEYMNLVPRWQDWKAVQAACAHITTAIFDRVCDFGDSGAGERPEVLILPCGEHHSEFQPCTLLRAEWRQSRCAP